MQSAPNGAAEEGSPSGGKSTNSSHKGSKPKQPIRPRPGFLVFHYFSSPQYLGFGKFRKFKPNDNGGKHIQFSLKAKHSVSTARVISKNMKNANKGQHKSQNGFMTLLLFLKTLQWKPEIWEETLHRLHLLGFIFPHFRVHHTIPSYSVWVGLSLCCCSGGIRHIPGYCW